MKVFCVQYEVRPTKDHEEFATVGGAFVDCLVRSSSATQATQLAEGALREEEWFIVSLEKGPLQLNRAALCAEWQEHFVSAMDKGEFYAFHSWPVGRVD